MEIISTLNRIIRSQLIDKDKIIAFEQFLDEFQNFDFVDGVKIKNIIKNEHFLEENILVNLINIIHENKQAEAKVIYKAIKKIIRREEYLQKGGDIRIRLPKYVGTVIPYNVFKNNLSEIPENSLKLPDEECINTFCDEIELLGVVGEFYRTLILKDPERLIWLTFDLDTDNPFSFIRLNLSEEYLITLGLSDYRTLVDKKIIALIFQTDELLKRDILLYRPTFCDSNLYPHFFPTTSEIRFGESKPIGGGIIEHNNQKYIYPKRPEIIIKSKYLEFKYLDRLIVVE